MSKRILILMTVYNESLSMLHESIESIKNQTYSRFDAVIVVDNPDISCEIKSYLASLCEIDRRFNILINEFNCGLANSLNAGFKYFDYEKYEFIARMDADDICFLDRFERQITYFETNEKTDLLGTSAIKIDEFGKVIGSFNVIPNVTLKFGSNSIHPSWMMRKHVFKTLNGYRDFVCSQDYDFLCRAELNKFVIKNLNESCLYYRIRSDSLGSNNRLNQRRIKYFISSQYRKGSLLNTMLPKLDQNVMTWLFKIIEKKKVNNRLYKVLMLFSLYHLRNFYLLIRKSIEI